MKAKATLSFALLCVSSFVYSAAQDAPKPPDPSERARVFITDSQSWAVAGSSGGGGGAFAGHMSGGARPQTAEIIKTFGERCPDVMVNNIQAKTDYVVVLDHEGGKSILAHKNKVAVFARISGDSIVSKSTLSLGGSVQEACEAIRKDWTANGTSLRAAAAAEAQKAAPSPQPIAAVSAAPAAPTAGKLSVNSNPDGADIEVDGSFVGNTPSDVQVSEGEHTISVKKAGFATWDRKMKVSGGSSVRLNAELVKAP